MQAHQAEPGAAHSRGQDESSSDDDDLFVPRTAPSQKPGADDADAIDGLDSSVTAVRENVPAAYTHPDAIAALRDRFVTGGCPAGDNLLCICSVSALAT